MIRELSTMPPFQGSLNLNVPYHIRNQYGRSSIGLLRSPRENKDLLKNLDYEYTQIGFRGLGGTMRLRKPHEQEMFAERAASMGLRVLPPLQHEDAKKVFFPYVEGLETLDKHLHGAASVEAKQLTIITLFDDLRHAHEIGVVYGDRWAGNMMVHPKYGLLHLDWDIELGGNFAKELDAAQVIYHTLWAAKMSNDPSENIAMPIITNILKTIGRGWLHSDILLKFVNGLERFLRKTPVGQMEETILYFTEIIKSYKI